MLIKFVRLKCFLVALGYLSAFSIWPVHGQVPGSTASPIPTLGLTPALPTPTPGLQALPQTPDLVPTPTPTPPVDVTQTPTISVRNPTGEPGDPKRSTESSFWLDSYPLNDLSQYLAHEAGFQFFQNPKIADITVTGELFKQGNAMEALHALALQYDLVFYQKGRTLFLLTQDQFHSPSFFTTQRYRLKHQLAEYLLEPIANFLGIVAKPAGPGFPGYPNPVNSSASVGAANPTSGGPTSSGNSSAPRYQPGVPFDAPLSTGGFSGGDSAGQVSQNAVSVERSSNSLIVRASPQDQSMVAREISRLDREERQILIKTYVVEVDAGNGLGGGIDWSTALGTAPGQGATFSLQSPGQASGGSNATGSSGQQQSVANGVATLGQILNTLVGGKLFTNGLILNVNNLQVVLQALQSSSRIKSNNSPMTVAKSGIPVTIRSTTTQTIFLQTAATANVQATNTPYVFNTGLTIDLIARILDGGLIDMNLNPALSTITGQSQAQPGTTGTVPIISTRSTTANVTVRSGQAAVIGGILQDGQTFTQNGIPAISRIPVLGYLFKSRLTSTARTNLIVIVCPTIVPAASQRTDRLGEQEESTLEISSDLPGEPPPIPSGRSGKEVRFISKSKRQ
jgi:Bacterial type II and III secretion system protein